MGRDQAYRNPGLNVFVVKNPRDGDINSLLHSEGSTQLLGPPSVPLRRKVAAAGPLPGMGLPSSAGHGSSGPAPVSKPGTLRELGWPVHRPWSRKSKVL